MMLLPEVFQALIREAHVFFRLVERKARIALGGESEVGNGAVGGLATIHEEVILTMERLDTRFQGRNFCIETLNTRPIALLVSQIYATEGRHHKGVIFPGYGGHVGLNWQTRERESMEDEAIGPE
jgi:hypothetical protein